MRSSPGRRPVSMRVRNSGNCQSSHASRNVRSCAVVKRMIGLRLLDRDPLDLQSRERVLGVGREVPTLQREAEERPVRISRMYLIPLSRSGRLRVRAMAVRRDPDRSAGIEQTPRRGGRETARRAVRADVPQEVREVIGRGAVAIDRGTDERSTCSWWRSQRSRSSGMSIGSKLRTAGLRPPAGRWSGRRAGGRPRDRGPTRGRRRSAVLVIAEVPDLTAEITLDAADAKRFELARDMVSSENPPATKRHKRRHKRGFRDPPRNANAREPKSYGTRAGRQTERGGLSVSGISQAHPRHPCRSARCTSQRRSNNLRRNTSDSSNQAA